MEKKKRPVGDCTTCNYYTYDDEDEAYYCDLNLDEDDYYHFMTHSYKSCPYYVNGDEYRVVRHQM
ncbi:MAG: DUF6472 family protein [Lachnospiraceae bacterium]|jgi:hypothetical protein|nr:DUF6472 family protein [Lachnospiraceae bacterium]MDD6667903.1 DUF6472 family protein [Lachnospiraceae bacterium]